MLESNVGAAMTPAADESNEASATRIIIAAGPRMSASVMHGTSRALGECSCRALAAQPAVDASMNPSRRSTFITRLYWRNERFSLVRNYLGAPQTETPRQNKTLYARARKSLFAFPMRRVQCGRMKSSNRSVVASSASIARFISSTVFPTTT